MSLIDGLIYNKKGLNNELDCGDCNMCCKLPNINKTYFKDTIFKKDRKHIWTFASYEEGDELFSDRNVFPIGCIVKLEKVTL